MGHPSIVYFGLNVFVLFHTFKYAYFYFRFHIVGIDSLINFSVYIYILNRISGVMVSVLASSTEYRGFEPQLGQT
jgi:hypothetical protein